MKITIAITGRRRRRHVMVSRGAPQVSELYFHAIFIKHCETFSYMIGVPSAGEGRLTIGVSMIDSSRPISQRARRGRIRNVTKTVNSDEVEYET